MKTTDYFVIGVMSGTSLDGIDLCYTKLSFSATWRFEILHASTYQYSDTWKTKLSEAIHLSELQLGDLDAHYSRYTAEKIQQFITENQIHNIDAICSHGHTVFHQPEIGLTKQIGNQPSVSEYLNHTVVCDFRPQDVALGGQGAPLVPIGDELLFSHFDYCLNLGGFANISFNKDNQRIAFDICAANVLLNHFSNKLNLAYDENGSIAASGKVNSDLLQSLNALDFYSASFPKSLGMEWVNKEVLPLINGFELEVNDILRTLTEHIAVQIGLVLESKPNARVLATGGGAYNTILIERIMYFTPGEIVIPDAQIIEFKEALVFALLGVLKLRNEINCLSSVTGAKYDHSSGNVFNP